MQYYSVKRIVKATSWNGSIFRVTGHLCGNSPVPGEFPAHRPVTRSFDVFCVWISSLVNNREAGDLRRHRAHYDVIVMCGNQCPSCCLLFIIVYHSRSRETSPYLNNIYCCLSPWGCISMKLQSKFKFLFRKKCICNVICKRWPFCSAHSVLNIKGLD